MLKSALCILKQHEDRLEAVLAGSPEKETGTDQLARVQSGSATSEHIKYVQQTKEKSAVRPELGTAGR